LSVILSTPIHHHGFLYFLFDLFLFLLFFDFCQTFSLLFLFAVLPFKLRLYSLRQCGLLGCFPPRPKTEQHN
jgi:hypothetical protein